MRLLTQEALLAIDNIPIRRKLAKLFGKHEQQIRRYIAANDPILTTISALCLLEKELNIPAYELLEPGEKIKITKP